MDLAAENRCVETRGELGHSVSHGGRAPGWLTNKAACHAPDVIAALAGPDPALHTQNRSVQTVGVSA